MRPNEIDVSPGLNSEVSPKEEVPNNRDLTPIQGSNEISTEENLSDLNITEREMIDEDEDETDVVNEDRGVNNVENLSEGENSNSEIEEQEKSTAPFFSCLY